MRYTLYTGLHLDFQTLYENWNIKPHHKYFSYFYSSLIVIFGSSNSNATNLYASFALEFFNQAIFLVFPIAKTADTKQNYVVERNFTAYCEYVQLSGGTTNLNLLTAECKTLILPVFSLPWSTWELVIGYSASPLKLVNSLKSYSLDVALQIVLCQMTTLNKQPYNYSNLVVIFANLDFAKPFMPSYADSDTMKKSLILVGNWSFSFVTCSSLSEGRFNYWGYVKPFNIKIWYALMVSCLFITILLIGQNGSKYWALSWYELASAMFNAVLDVAFIVAERSSSTLRIMFQSPASEQLIILWTMVTFVIVNIYKSIVTEDITAPLVSSPPETFDDLISGRFRIYSSPIMQTRTSLLIPETMMSFRVGEGELDEEIYGQFLSWMASLSLHLAEVVNAIGERHSKAMLNSEDNSRLDLKSFLKQNRNNVTLVQQEFMKHEVGKIAGISQVVGASLISEVVGQCDKTAFVTPSIYMMSKRYLLSILGGDSSHLNRKPYIKGGDTVFSRRVYIRIGKTGMVSEVLKGRMEKLLEGGFYQFWQDLIVNAHTVGRMQRRGEEAFLEQQLNSNILTIFFMFGISVGLCVFIFLSEFGLSGRTRIEYEIRILIYRCSTLQPLES